MENEVLTVSQFHQILNQTLEFAYPAVVIEGEVASFKVSHNKWVFFDLKDEECTIGCFIPIYNLKVGLEDGMLVRVMVSPNLTKWGKFSLTVKAVELAGEGTVKKAFEILKAKFDHEGLFAPERKRLLPKYPKKIALVTSRQAAAFNDFIKIIEDRWSGLVIDQAQVQVQGMEAPGQIVRAIGFFNSRAKDYDAMVIIRGGGSFEDLQAFNHEDVVRAVYASKIPCIVGIGHEDDTSLAELAADVRAATPSDAARRLVSDKKELLKLIDSLQQTNFYSFNRSIERIKTRIEQVNNAFLRLYHQMGSKVDFLSTQNNHNIDQLIKLKIEKVVALTRMLVSLDPRAILARGYSIATIGGKVVTSSNQIKVSSRVMLQLYKGSAELVRPRGFRDDGTSKKSVKDEKNRQAQLGF